MSTLPFRVLFICMGNICRSPAAEIVFHHLLEAENLTESIHTDSAGTIGYHKGSAPDPRMSETLRRRGYRIFGKSRPIKPEDLEIFDLILVADQENLRDVLALAKDNQPTGHIQLLTDYCTRHESTHVPDPYYGGNKGFETVANLVEDACQNLLKKVRQS
ncbi:low molecular weight protein-tyrosine-phosphatase [Luteolibacter sp. AS25]|uniref:low molecular weight protein-tyrosine-phosphatase n=1 Tax=Luteolibacter sp. AS25 TaxID=3135776 RepID=UPI00398B04D9